MFLFGDSRRIRGSEVLQIARAMRRCFWFLQVCLRLNSSSICAVVLACIFPFRVRSFTRSLFLCFFVSLLHALTHSLTHSLHSLHSLTHCTHSLHSLTHSFTNKMQVRTALAAAGWKVEGISLGQPKWLASW